MNIKHIKNAFGFAFAAIFFVGCTDVESINDVDLNQTNKTDEYYAALRKWKETPGLPQVFVWFDIRTSNEEYSGKCKSECIFYMLYIHILYFIRLKINSFSPTTNL